jgi:aldehyde dehydrogenase (NAD(P)+)
MGSNILSLLVSSSATSLSHRSQEKSSPASIPRMQHLLPSDDIHEVLTSQFRTEETIACVNAACGDDVDVAVQAARKALSDPSWKFLSSTDRGNLIMKLANLVDQHKKTLATIESWDTGTVHCYIILN